MEPKWNADVQVMHLVGKKKKKKKLLLNKIVLRVVLNVARCLRYKRSGPVALGLVSLQSAAQIVHRFIFTMYYKCCDVF